MTVKYQRMGRLLGPAEEAKRHDYRRRRRALVMGIELS